MLTNAVGVNSTAVAEHALALMLSFARKLHTQRDNQHKKHWRPMISVISDREFELGHRYYSMRVSGGSIFRVKVLAPKQP